MSFFPVDANLHFVDFHIVFLLPPRLTMNKVRTLGHSHTLSRPPPPSRHPQSRIISFLTPPPLVHFPRPTPQPFQAVTTILAFAFLLLALDHFTSPQTYDLHLVDSHNFHEVQRYLSSLQAERKGEKKLRWSDV